MVKQEITRVNINILGISELKWTKMGKFNSDYHYIYYYGQESLRRNRVALIFNKSLKWSTCVQSQKWQNDLCFQGKPFSIRVIQVYAPTINGKKLKLVLWWSTRPRTNTKKNVLFIIGDWNANVGSQEILGVQNEVGQRLTEFCKENTLVIAHTLLQQQKRQLYTWTSPDGQHQNQTDYILCSQR